LCQYRFNEAIFVVQNLAPTTARIGELFSFMGRPTDYNQDIADRICERMICGQNDKPESLRSICRDEIMPSTGTVMRWVAKHPEFQEQYRAAREAQVEVHHEEILEISDNCTDDVQMILGNAEEGELGRINHSAVARAKLQVDTRKWIMSKMAPKKYGEKVQVENSGKVVIAEETDEEIAARFAAKQNGG
jgi:hypothetical protein